jgi:hypothetical protein
MFLIRPEVGVHSAQHLSSSDHPWITTVDAAGQAQAIGGVTRKPLSCCMNLALSGTIFIYPPAPPPAPGTRRERPG